MSVFDPEQMEEIILSHFADSEPALCPKCGWELMMDSQVVSGFGLQFLASCQACSLSGEWQQPQPERPWKLLHLDYFREAFLADQLIRCPFDDCYVSHAEFESHRVKFICPYCNRRGIITIEG